MAITIHSGLPEPPSAAKMGKIRACMKLALHCQEFFPHPQAVQVEIDPIQVWPLGTATGAVALGNNLRGLSVSLPPPPIPRLLPLPPLSLAPLLLFLLLPHSESLRPLPFLPGNCMTYTTSRLSHSQGLGCSMGRLLLRDLAGDGGDPAVGAGLPLSLAQPG